MLPSATYATSGASWEILNDRQSHSSTEKSQSYTVHIRALRSREQHETFLSKHLSKEVMILQTCEGCAFEMCREMLGLFSTVVCAQA